MRPPTPPGSCTTPSADRTGFLGVRPVCRPHPARTTIEWPALANGGRAIPVVGGRSPVLPAAAAVSNHGPASGKWERLRPFLPVSNGRGL